jgi:hypothetical protein
MNADQLNAFLGRADPGQRQRVLAIFPSKAALMQFKIDAINAADARDMPMQYYRKSERITMFHSTIHLRVAHERLGDSVVGMAFTAVYGIDCLNRFENGHEQAQKVRARLREPAQ